MQLYENIYKKFSYISAMSANLLQAESAIPADIY